MTDSELRTALAGRVADPVWLASALGRVADEPAAIAAAVSPIVVIAKASHRAFLIVGSRISRSANSSASGSP